MENLFDVAEVVVFGPDKKRVASATGDIAIRLLICEVLRNGEAGVIELRSAAGPGTVGRKVLLAISHKGDLQVGHD